MSPADAGEGTDRLSGAAADGPDEMGREIADGPRAAAATLDVVGRLSADWEPMLAAAQRVVLVGTGASLAAARIAAPLWRSVAGAGLTIVTRQSTEAALGDLDGLPIAAADVVIAISQSGASPETLAAARGAVRAGAACMAVTAHPESALAALATLTLALQSGKEHGASTKSELATVAALLALAGALQTDDLSQQLVARRLEALVGEWETVRAQGRLLADAPHTWVLGFGAANGIAQAGLLLWHEKVRRPVVAATPSEFRHGHVEAAGRGDAVIVIDDGADGARTTGYLRRLAAEAERVGARVLSVGAAANDRSTRTANGAIRFLEALLRIQQLARATALAAGTYQDGFATLRTVVRPAHDLFD
jgi:glutamine---fructose-6-phosphate transaminase (isomerizing)